MNSDSINLVKKWLLESGIQNMSKNEKVNGGFNGFYDLYKKTYPFVYSEITGYGITTLLYMNQKMSEILAVERAKLAAKWLMANAFHDSGGFKTRYFPPEDSFRNNLLYTFDAGMILFGFINLFKITKDEKYLEDSKKVADFLIKCQKKDGLFYPIYDGDTGTFVETKGKWSTQSGGYHAKIAMAMIEMFNATKEEQYMNSAKNICDAVLKLQAQDGRFVIEKETHFHPHCYTAEGLLYVGTQLNNKKYIASAVKACMFPLENQLPNGGVAYLYSKGKLVPFERIDILAQVLRLGCLQVGLGVLDKKYVDSLNKLKDRLCEFQHSSGGFLFGTDFDGKKLNNLNSWGSMFALQALDIYDRIFQKKEKTSVDLLV